MIGIFCLGVVILIWFFAIFGLPFLLFDAVIGIGRGILKEFRGVHGFQLAGRIIMTVWFALGPVWFLMGLLHH